MNNTAPASCDIFCNVIDNFGDIGVCWRLARQLAQEHGLSVRLWVDDLVSFAMLCPEADVVAEQQKCKGVEVRRWHKEFPDVQPAELVIEAYACKLPQNYLEAMAKIQTLSVQEAKMDARRQGFVERDSTNQYSEGDEAAANNADASLVGRKPVWINLEYLSAEEWVESHHKLPSPHPRLPLTKFFFFPGFTTKTGGLLLERDLLARRDAFQSDTAQQQAFWRSFGMEIPAAEILKISLFAYENAALDGLLDAWASGNQPVLCMVPEGRIMLQAGRYFGAVEPHAGSAYTRGNLHVRIAPFVEQERYDELLWTCDVNFVRGEDSLVRAIWAGRPFVWQIYPQHDKVHLKKLQAFLMLYGERLGRPASRAVEDLWLAWNRGSSCDTLPAEPADCGNSCEADAYENGSLPAMLRGSCDTLPAKPADCGNSRKAASDEKDSASIMLRGDCGDAGRAWDAYAAVVSDINRSTQDWARQLAENNLALNLLDFCGEIGRMRALKIEG